MSTRTPLLVAVLVSAHALAGWTQIGAANGTPQDVVVVDGGVIVTTSTEAQAIAPDGGVFGLLQGAVYVGAGLDTTGCLVALTNARVLRHDPRCGGASTPVSGTNAAQRFRLFPSGAVAYVLGSASDVLYGGPSTAGPFVALTAGWLARSPRSLGTATVAGAEVAVCNEAQTPNFFLAVSVDGGAVVNRSVGFVANDAVPFSQAGQLAILAVVTDGGLAIVSTPSRPTSVPASATVLTVAFVTEDSDAGQRGYGLATTSSGAVLSPIPDPARPGEVWVLRANAPALTGRVHCENARSCAGLVADGGVQLLSNTNSPTFTFDAGAPLQPGPVTLGVTPVDLDDDPVFISWDVPGHVVTPTAPDHREVQLSITRAATCNQDLPITITAWDGLATHEHTETFRLRLPNPVGTLVISPSNPQARAGGAGVTFVAALDAGCGDGAGPELAAWSVDGDSRGTATQVTVQPPLTVCNAAGLDQVVRAVASGQNATTTLHVAPWGLAAPPTFQRGTQDAGTTQRWGPTNADHACAAAAGFPGTSLDWEWDAGDSGIVAAPTDGGLSVTAPECLTATFSATATRSVVGSPDRSSAGVLVIDVSPNLKPVSASTPFAMGFVYDAGVASGTLSVGVNCPAARQLSASVELTLLDGGVAARQIFAAPGPWALPFTEGCAGGTFTATARLFEQGKDTGAVDRATAFTAPAQPVVVGAITPTEFTASCGAGARGTVTLALAQGSCEAATVSWAQRAGPAITQAAQARSLSFQTVSTGFDIVGTTVALDAVVSAGANNHTSASAQLHIGAPRFVAVAHHLEPLQPTSEDVLSFSVAITNHSDCAADELVVSELAHDVVLDPTSAALDGRPITARSAEQRLEFAPFALEARQTRRLTFTGRARLLGTPRLQAAATLRGVRVELPADDVARPDPCGCSSLDASLGLLGLVAWRRRRAKAA